MLQRAEVTLADLTQQQKEVQDDCMQKLIPEHVAAREDHRSSKTKAAQARHDAAAAVEWA